MVSSTVNFQFWTIFIFAGAVPGFHATDKLANVHTVVFTHVLEYNPFGVKREGWKKMFQSAELWLGF